MLLLIDNYDSFTYNLARYFIELGQDVKVVRNDRLSCDDIASLAPNYIVLSPGPKAPDQAGISLKAIERFAGKIPLLGVCLGHQAIGQVFGAQVTQAAHIMHGKISTIEHSSSDLYQHVPSPFAATRYHSLLLEPNSIAHDFNVTSWCNETGQDVMSIEHQELPIVGIQYHPESVLTVFGKQILNNFIQIYDTKRASEKPLNVVLSGN